MKNLSKRFYKYVLLNILSMVGVSAYYIVDTIFISKGMGTDGLVALNFVMPIFSVMSSLQLMVAVGTSTSFAILSSKGQKERANRAYTYGVYIALILGSLSSLTGLLFARDISSFFGARGDVLNMSAEYIRIILSFSIFFFLNNLYVVFLRNDYKPKTSMLASLLGNLCNIIFDYVFIFIFDWEMKGAALATATSPIIGLLIMSPHILKENTGFSLIKIIKPSFKEIISSLAPGFALFANDMSGAVKMAVFNYMFLFTIGNIGVASYGVISNFAIIFFASFYGVGEGVQPLISSAYGRGETDEIIFYMRKGYRFSFLLGLGLIVFTFGFLSPIVRLFNWENNQQLAFYAVEGMKLFLVSLLFASQSICAMLYQAAMDNPKRSLTISLLRGLIFMVPSVIVLGSVFGYEGVYFGMILAEAFTFLYSTGVNKKTIAELSVFNIKKGLY